jgi:sulfur-carrier protein
MGARVLSPILVAAAELLVYARRGMILTILAFAQSQDVFGFSRREVEAFPDDTPRGLLLRLRPGADLGHLRVALDCEFAEWDLPLGNARELAILPPVSGG